MDPNEVRIRHLSRPSRTRPSNARRGTRSRRRGEHPAEVTSRPIADEIRIIRRGTPAHSLCCPPEKVAQIVGQVLERVGGAREGRLHLALAENLVVNDVVMRRPGGALDRGVCLQEKIPVAGFGYAAIDDGTVWWVPGAIGLFLLRWVEARVVPFTDDGDGHVGLPGFGHRGWIDVLTSFAEGGEFVF